MIFSRSIINLRMNSFNKYFLFIIASLQAILLYSCGSAAVLYMDSANQKYAEGDYLGAIRDFSAVIELEPENFNAFFKRGNVYSTIKKHQWAIEDYNKVTDLNSSFAQAFLNRGIEYINIDNHRAALEDFNKAIELKPDDADAYKRRGYVYGKIGNYQQSIKDFQIAARL